MRYTINDLVETSGIPPRTIRRYIALRIIPRPDGNGGGALYTDHHLELVIAISRMKAQGLSLAVCVEELSNWSEPRLRRYLKETEPKAAASAPAAEAPAARPPPTPLPPGAPPLPLPPKKGKTSKGEPGALTGPVLLPNARGFKFIPILPDLMLLVGEGATPLVQRVAAEIYEKYGAGT
jgi:DNA-binding transcriptional MerR regulator